MLFLKSLPYLGFPVMLYIIELICRCRISYVMNSSYLGSSIEVTGRLKQSTTKSKGSSQKVYIAW